MKNPTQDISPIELANALTPHWMRRIHEFDALEIQPCRVVGNDGLGNEIVEPCDEAPDEAAFWTVCLSAARAISPPGGNKIVSCADGIRGRWRTGCCAIITNCR